MKSDLAAALSLLSQTADLTRQIEHSAWVAPNENFRGSTLGQHVRHCLEHFEALLVFPSGQTVDYDSRRRDESIENSPDAAARRSSELLERLGLIGEKSHPDDPVNVVTSCSVECGGSARPSSFGRELQFLVSHTTHHFAIIAAICHVQRITLPPGFGIAPSTLRHREAIAQR